MGCAQSSEGNDDKYCKGGRYHGNHSEPNKNTGSYHSKSRPGGTRIHPRGGMENITYLQIDLNILSK